MQVFQIILSDEQVDEVNSASDAYPEFYNRYLDTTINPTAKQIAPALDAGDYTLVATVDTTGMEQAFAAMNGRGDQDRVTSLKRHKSMSVGDVIINDNGQRFFVATFGFLPV